MKALLAVLTLLAVAAPLRAQAAFQQATVQFDRAWRSADADGIAGMLASGGIVLQLLEESHSQVAGRQARAALSAFLGARERGSLEMMRAGELGGEPPKGSAEFQWRTVVQGTSEPVVYTLFVELTREGDRWHVSAIRVFQ